MTSLHKEACFNRTKKCVGIKYQGNRRQAINKCNAGQYSTDVASYAVKMNSFYFSDNRIQQVQSIYYKLTFRADAIFTGDDCSII